MANFLNNLGRVINEGLSEISTQTSAEAKRSEEISVLEVKLKEVDLKLEKNYSLLGQAVADTLRRVEPVDRESLMPLFHPIKDLDYERKEILEAIKEIKSKQADQLKAQELLNIKKQVETEVQKLKELKDLGVIDEDEFEVSQAKLNKRVSNFEKLYSLKTALERGLISQAEYMKRKAMLE